MCDILRQSAILKKLQKARKKPQTSRQIWQNEKRLSQESPSGALNRYLLKDTLDDHLHEIDSEAQFHFNTLLPLYCERYNVTEELKATDQMEWIRRMNNIVNAIEEIVFNRIVYR